MAESIENKETLNIDNLPDIVPSEDVDIESPTPPVEETPEVETQEEPEAIEEPKDEFSDWDKEKSVNAYRELQRKISERDKEAREEREERIRLEERLKLREQSTQESQPKPKKLEMPIEPIMPEGYSEVEAVAEPDGIFGQSKRAYDQYLRDMIKYQGQVLNDIKQETTISKQEREMAESERIAQGEFIKLGYSPEKATKAYKWASQPGTVTPERIMKLFEMEFPNEQSPDTKAKLKEMATQSERQKQVLPPGVVSTQPEVAKDDNPLNDVVDYVKKGRENRQF